MPMTTVRLRGRPQHSAASAVMEEVAMNNPLRQGAVAGDVPRHSSIPTRR
ncbi:hypothetical protein [Streptomyces tropicalis]|nr:hypothetical protein [Streptomyces tropicalis]